MSVQLISVPVLIVSSALPPVQACSRNVSGEAEFGGAVVRGGSSGKTLNLFFSCILKFEFE
jgi:hypothetical protein